MNKKNNLKKIDPIPCYQWFTGLLEADGGLYVSKQGYPSLEITMDEAEVQSLSFVKKLCGEGSVSPRKGAKAYRWRLHSCQSIANLLPHIAPHFHTEKTFQQYLKVVDSLKKYPPVHSTSSDEALQQRLATMFDRLNDSPMLKDKSPKRRSKPKKEIETVHVPHVNQSQIDNIFIQNRKVSFDSAWFSGFFCGDGCFYVSPLNFQVTFSISQADRVILEKIQECFKGGRIHFDIKDKMWVWQMSEKKGLHKIADYLSIFKLWNPLKEAQRFSMLRFLRYKERGDHLNPLHHARLRHFIHLIPKKK